MGIDLHTIAIAAGGSPPIFPDRLVMLIQKALAFKAAARSITAIDTITNKGTGYTTLPVMAFTGGTGAEGVGVVTALEAVSANITSPGAGGTSFNISDTITMPNGVVLSVASVTGTAIATLTVITAGSVTPSAPVNPAAPLSVLPNTGRNALINILWGISAVQIVNSGSYSVAPTGASFTPVDGNGSNAAVQSFKLGGNGLPIYVGVTAPGHPSPLVVTGTPSVPAIVSVAYKSQYAIALRLDPITAAVSIAAGTIDFVAQG